MLSTYEEMSEKMDLNLVEQLKVSLFENSIDVAIDYAEIGLDDLLSNISNSEILQKMPIVKTIYSVCKVGLAIQEKHLLRKTLVFINEFNSKRIKPKKLEKYKKKINERPHYAEEELGRVMILLNKILDDGKAVILAKLYRNFVAEEISWEQFCEFTDITERIFLSDIKVLLHGYEHNGVDLGEFPNYHLDRLISIGLFENHNRLGGTIFLSGGDSSSEQEVNKDVDITEIGVKYSKYGLEVGL